jgi:uncharacterized short protein YbdD (DUF466 family)
MTSFWKKFLRLAKSIKEYVDGDFAYENYLKHHAKIHIGEIPLDKKAFLKKLEKDKWNRINRCC